MKKILLLFILVQSYSIIFSQVTDSINKVIKITPKKTVASVFAGAVFAPQLHYFGRTDKQNSSAVLPTVLLQFDSVGLYASGTGVLLNNSTQSFNYAGTVTELGFRFGKQKGFAGNIYGNKFFYNTTQLPQSALKEQAGINFNFLSKFLNITSSGSAAFSDSRTDFFTSGGLNRNFKLKKGKSVFVITPTAVINGGSQNFTNAYYKQNTIAGIPVNNTLITDTVRSFKILSYDFSAPVIWAYKSVFLIVTPTFVLPKNVIKNPAFPQLSENAKNLFFVNITALYGLKFYKRK